MKKLGQLYRSGIWTVKPGKAEEFIQTWQASADWIADNQAGSGEGFLLQDSTNPNKFISFGFSSMPEKNEELLSSPESQAYMTKLRKLCEEIQPHVMAVVGYSKIHASDN